MPAGVYHYVSTGYMTDDDGVTDWFVSWLNEDGEPLRVYLHDDEPHVLDASFRHLDAQMRRLESWKRRREATS